MIDAIFSTVQAMLNKEQLGYLRPMHYNLFLNKEIRKLYDQLFTDLKTNVRKMNWMLDGRDLANLSEHTRQLLEFYSTEEEVSQEQGGKGIFLFPNDFEFAEDVFKGTTRIDKIHFNDFLDLQRNKYAKPSECSPVCSKVGQKLKVSPTSIQKIDLHYLRKPKTAKWTYVDFQGKAMFNPDSNDFQDVDMPENFYDDLISLVFEDASIYLREFNATQTANQEQAQDAQLENKE